MFKVKNEQTQKEVKKEVKTLEDAMKVLLKDGGGNIFDITDLFLHSLAKMSFGSSGVGTHIKTSIGGEELHLKDEVDLGEALAMAEDPKMTLEMIRQFYHNYFKEEFNKVFNEKMGI